MATNLLLKTRSSYLLQHANNPVHWQPYSKLAMDKARELGKPVFISIGYAACHWCHVMAHESFEDEKTADFLNVNFINIKVDREEHPDIDHYLQRACQLMHQNGGWPLSAFVTHDLKPFFVGTYFPKAPRHNMPSFLQICHEIKRAWNEEHENVLSQAQQIHSHIMSGFKFKEKIEFPGHFPAPMAIIEAVKHLWDEKNGGFGSAPKFPMFSFWEWASECALEGTLPREEISKLSLAPERILMGGVSDHARGGVHRYSVDNEWMVPHFEKMLYDQCGYLSMLSKFSNIYSSPLCYDAINNTLDYLEKEMLSEQHFFFSAQDADSEGGEGLFFTFGMNEFEDALVKSGHEELVENKEKLKEWFSITPEGNFEHGLSVVSLNPLKKDEFHSPEGWKLVRQTRQALLAARKERIPPATDTKGLAAQNFRLLSSLIDVIQYCRIDAIRSRANQLLNTALPGIYKTFLEQKGDKVFSIIHSTSLDENMTYCENYVFYAEAMLRLFEMTATPVFKQNFRQTLLFIRQEFVHENKLHTRSISQSRDQLIPNEVLSSFDVSYPSILSTFCHCLVRGAVLLGEEEWYELFLQFKEQVVQEALHNPLGSGQALRALTYPKEAIRKIQLPSKWTQEERFINMTAYFMPRFVFDYHHDDHNRWQICDLKSCQMQGDGLDDFLAQIAPPNQENNI